MNKTEMIGLLLALIRVRDSFLNADGSENDIYKQDIEALSMAIQMLRGKQPAGEVSDPVNHPGHYCFGGIETINYIQAKLSKDEYHGYLKGSVLKYLSRAGHKGDEKEDLKKARWYLDRMIHDAVNTGRN